MANLLSNLEKTVFGKAKRLGRGLGSGKGAKSGRGTTRHQKGREDIPLYFEGGQGRLVKKYPLLRGKGINKSIKAKSIVIDFGILNQLKDGDTVTTDLLVVKGLIDEKSKTIGVKILNRGKLEKKLIIKIPASKSAKKQVEKLGGRVEL
jgi:large subunit ribosomal protein L15